MRSSRNFRSSGSEGANGESAEVRAVGYRKELTEPHVPCRGEVDQYNISFEQHYGAEIVLDQSTVRAAARKHWPTDPPFLFS